VLLVKKGAWHRTSWSGSGCLLDAVDSLEVPRFTGLVRVRYPLVTESVPEPEQIELTSTTAREVDALIGPDGATENP
jgi:hypothetical protein